MSRARPRATRVNPNANRRMILFLVGIVPILLVLAYGTKVGLMLHHNGAGRDAFDRGDYDGSVAAFAESRSYNWFERWVAPFDEGTGHHAEGEYDAAIADYEAALKSVPDREECTVRINLALVHEVLGDLAQENRNFDGAGKAWKEGIDVLAAGDCPTDSGRGQEQTDDAAAVDERLRNKEQQNQQQQQQQQDPQPNEPNDPGQEPQDPGQGDPRRERLERNNERGLEQRREDQEYFRDRNYSRPDSW